MSMIDIPTLFERNDATRRSTEIDHTYCSDDEGCGVALTKRLSQLREEGVGCDVEFVVGTEREIIRAHRLVLGSGSKVFATMFYGKMSEIDQQEPDMKPELGRSVVEVPDVTPGAFTALVNFLYTDLNTDDVKLDDDTVMHTLYAAKKYDVRTLVVACVRYLMSCLNASNAVCLLAQARFFDEPFLMKRCLQMIDTNTDEALASPGLRDIDRETLSMILERSELDPSSELIIFRAAQSWSEAECERQHLDVTPHNQRTVLGPVLSLIRFPLMTVVQFGGAASSALLTCEEIAEVFLHLTVIPRPPVSYPTSLRCNGRSKHIVKRFPNVSGKRCNKRENRFCFTADRDILVTGYGIYGFVPMTKPHISFMDPTVALEWQAQVEIQVLNAYQNYANLGISRSFLGGFSSINRTNGQIDIDWADICLSPCLDSRETTTAPATNTTYAETVLLKGIMGDVKPLIANFSKPIQVPANTNYIAGMKFLSDATVQTYGGKDGVEYATVQLPFDESVTFHFQCFKNSYGSEDVSRFEGQLPEIHFFIQWPDGIH
ncbi:unnamed protein product [Anisakis simplex]|uniref:BTB domain-containing protein n=1 Tax=Anisakis simplex TaxID=6269 RepID=A0A0M3JWT6_ANISI|nr:unnamed protein product [Anisakis simplex]